MFTSSQSVECLGLHDFIILTTSSSLTGLINMELGHCCPIKSGSIICYSDLLIKKTRRKFLVLAIFSTFYRMTTYIIIPNELTSQHVVSGEFRDSRIVANQSDCSVVTVI